MRDEVVLDAESATLTGATEADIADRWLFAGNRNVVREVTVAGQRVVADGRHRRRDETMRAYLSAINTLLAR